MKQKITRKDLKRDDLVESFGRTVDYVGAHRKRLIQAGLAALGVAALAGAFLAVRAYRESRAGAELSAGLADLSAPLATDPGAASAARTFSTEAERGKAAEEHLRKAASYGGMAPARAAAVILAARAGRPAAGLDVFTRAARDGRAEVSAAAEIDAARLLAAQGKTTEAIDRLRRAIESPESKAPKDALLYALAQIYERSGSSSDARVTYQRIVSDYPNSPYRADARQKLPNG